ncbi:MAG: glycosyltransferase family 4 protein [Planctomycetes bacterium]|nr:glycosyltransferase family 4 protein [Planctomycetota bacterium]
MSRTILFISKFLWTTGERAGVQVVYRALRAYRDAGYDVRLFVPTNTRRTPRKVVYDGMIVENIYVDVWPFGGACDYLGYRPRDLSPPVLSSLLWRATILIFTMKAVARGVRIARGRNVALVYAFSAFACPAAYLISFLTGLPVVTRLIGTTRFFDALQRRFGAIVQHLWWIAIKGARDLIITTNDGSRTKDACLRLGVEEKRIRFWLDGIEKGPFRKRANPALRKKLGIPKSAAVLGMFTQLIRYRGVHRAINAMAEVAKRSPDARLLIVGDGIERLRLERQVAALGLRDAVMFLGRVPWAEVAGLMKIVDICVACGDGSNLPNSILEAMVSGRCVVIRDTGGMGEVIQNGENGLLVSADEGKALGRALVDLVRDKMRRQRLGRNARKWAAENIPDWPERMAREIETIERDVLAEVPNHDRGALWAALFGMLALAWFLAFNIAYYCGQMGLVRRAWSAWLGN